MSETGLPPDLPPGLAAIAAGLSGAGVPGLEVALQAPDIKPWLDGNVLPGVWSFSAEAAGPHVAVVALTHGNEIAGAILLDRWLRGGLRPVRGRLSFVFANLAAYQRFDPADPTATRFLDEDLNRLWDAETLESQRRSIELRRAQALRPFIDSVDVLLDLHSMLWPSDALILAGQAPRAHRLAQQLGTPPLVVADQGHAAGRRLIDYARFLEDELGPTALLLEAGNHWQPDTVAQMQHSTARLLRHCGVVAADDPLLPTGQPLPGGRLALVTQTVTAATNGFSFLRPYRGGEVIGPRNTLIALDGEQEIRTPHADCLLVMPSLRTARGHTAVRLARFVGQRP